MYQYKDLYKIDFTKVNYFFEFHFVIKETLDFPDYYGCDWSAFWDCLTDMIGRPVHIEIIGLDTIEQKIGSDFVKKMLEILKRFKNYDKYNYSHEIQIEIVRNNKREILKK